MSCSSINKKGMQDYLDIPKCHIFIWNAKTLLKKLYNVFFFALTSLIFCSKPLECKFVINEINLIVFINTLLL
jgi:hypothetical protein